MGKKHGQKIKKRKERKNMKYQGRHTLRERKSGK